MGILSVGSYVPLICFCHCICVYVLHCFLCISFLFGTTGGPRFILCRSCPVLDSGAWFLLLENDIKNQDLGDGVNITPGVLLFLGALS